MIQKNSYNIAMRMLDQLSSEKGIDSNLSTRVIWILQGLHLHRNFRATGELAKIYARGILVKRNIRETYRYVETILRGICPKSNIEQQDIEKKRRSIAEKIFLVEGEILPTHLITLVGEIDDIVEFGGKLQFRRKLLELLQRSKNGENINQEILDLFHESPGFSYSKDFKWFFDV